VCSSDLNALNTFIKKETKEIREPKDKGLFGQQKRESYGDM
jgi:hypothetical protein